MEITLFLSHSIYEQDKQRMVVDLEEPFDRLSAQCRQGLEHYFANGSALTNSITGTREDSGKLVNSSCALTTTLSSTTNGELYVSVGAISARRSLRIYYFCSRRSMRWVDVSLRILPVAICNDNKRQLEMTAQEPAEAPARQYEFRTMIT